MNVGPLEIVLTPHDAFLFALPSKGFRTVDGTSHRHTIPIRLSIRAGQISQRSLLHCLLSLLDRLGVRSLKQACYLPRSLKVSLTASVARTSGADPPVVGA